MDASRIRQFEGVRNRFYESLDEIRREGDELLSRLREREAVLRDAALFAGLHERKKALFEQFLRREDEFLEATLRLLKE